METLSGQVAIITGGGSGIGKAIALALAQQGVNVAVCGRHEERLDETAKTIEEMGGNLFKHSCRCVSGCRCRSAR